MCVAHSCGVDRMLMFSEQNVHFLMLDRSIATCQVRQSFLKILLDLQGLALRFDAQNVARRTAEEVLEDSKGLIEDSKGAANDV